MKRLGLDPAAVHTWGAALVKRAYATGLVPAIGSAEWIALDDTDPRKPAAAVLAALAYIAEAMPAAIAARLDAEDREAAQRVKDAAVDLSTAGRWGTGPTRRELEQRRNTYPPARHIDPDAVARWVATGSSHEPQERVA